MNGENQFRLQSQRSTMDLSISLNGINVTFIQICFQSRLSVKQVCCEAVFNSMSFPGKIFCRMISFGAFQVKIENNQGKPC